jgi:serine/threonine protein kinase
VAQLFPQLEIIELIGQGGMGAVYRARQPALDRLVALKILAPRPGSDHGFTERFTREARALARLNHPNIVAVHDFGHVPLGDRPGTSAGDKSPAGAYLHYFVMEFVDGANLRQIEQARRLSPREALRIIPQICEALQFAHDEGIVHRDIKPENVLVDKKGRVKIADFGLAKILALEAKNLRLTGARDVMGTPHYMAPEQVEHPQAVDHRADIYSLGVVFYEMLTGELPLGRFSPPSRKVEVDVRLDEVVLHALEKEPERRYQQASQVKTDVQTIVDGNGSPAHASTPPAAIAQGAERTRVSWKIAVGSLATVLLIVLAAWLFQSLPRARGKSSSTLQANLLVIGTVTDVTGAPIAGARVADNSYGSGAERAVQEAWTDVSGHYELKTWNEEHSIAASAPGCEISMALLRNQAAAAQGRVQMNFRLMPAEGAALPVPPVVVRTVPEAGATDVDPGLTELQVTFSSPMQDQSWSWSSCGEDTFPEVRGPIRYEPDGRTCVLPVKLRPGKTYATWLNSQKFHGFQDRQGRPAVPYLLIFETRKESVNP